MIRLMLWNCERKTACLMTMPGYSTRGGQAQLTPVRGMIYKALDGMEAVLQHNEADLSTWEENEYTLNLHYAEDRVGFSPCLTALRQAIRAETEEKLAAGR